MALGGSWRARHAIRRRARKQARTWWLGICCGSAAVLVTGAAVLHTHEFVRNKWDPAVSEGFLQQPAIGGGGGGSPRQLSISNGTGNHTAGIALLLCNIPIADVGERLIALRTQADVLTAYQQANNIKACTADVTDYSSYPVPLVDPCGLLGWTPYVVGLLYMFVGLAVVCDEYFVPTLEVIAERFDLSDDVAGATVMAAGGSAPELFTSLMGTFLSRSNVGFGTVVGSAVFNILFVIGMCAVFSREVLELSWYPLARDSSFYALSLTVLAIFYGVSTPNMIDWWESLTLLGLYATYVTIMKKNEMLHTWIKGTAAPNRRATSTVSPDMGAALQESSSAKPRKTSNGSTIPAFSFNRHSKFRAGLLHIMYSKYQEDDLLERARVHIVADLEGDVNSTFKQIDLNGDGFIDGAELAAVLAKLLDEKPDHHALERALNEISGQTGKISLEDFSVWYNASADRVLADLREYFELMDKDKDGKLNRTEVQAVIAAIQQHGPSENTVDDAIAEFDELDDVVPALNLPPEPADGSGITLPQFETWYQRSMLWEQTVDRLQREGSARDAGSQAGDDDEGGPFELEWPDNRRGQILFILTLPVVLPLYLTIPDVRNPKYTWVWPVSWFLAISWIATYSYFMVWWAMILGDVIGVPPAIMGLTFLAAGTSIPDLITSVIVARQGLGDMAVSSSIGSNIFDILIGLPVPWILYSAIYGESTGVQGSDLLWSVIILIFMLICAIVTIAFNGWKMTRNLGLMFFGLYFIFLGSEIARNILSCG